jgi:hypothetical protein
MRPFLHNFGAIVLIISGFGATSACHRVHSAQPPVAAAPASPVAAVPEQDAAWSKRAAVVNVDPGNSVTKRRSESAFTPRTSRASVDSHTSSLLVQVAALNHIVSIHKPLVEQQLREMGLNVVGMKHSKLHAPNSFNVLVEDVTYVEEVERKNAWDPVIYTLTPTIHVRVISANERSTLEAAPIMVRSYGTMTPEAADTYGRKLALARLELGKRLVDWLGGRLSLTPAGTASSAASKPVGPPKVKTPPRSAKSKKDEGAIGA